ncbi:unnamed protein product, partial [Larinioides sclopetarius]
HFLTRQEARKKLTTSISCSSYGPTRNTKGHLYYSLRISILSFM